jgi:hypothetical protein
MLYTLLRFVLQFFLSESSLTLSVLFKQDIKTAYQLYGQVKASHQVARLKYLQDPKLCSEAESVAAQYDWKEIPTGIKRSFHCYWSIMTLFSVSLLLIDSMYTLSGEFFYNFFFELYYLT